MDFKTKACRKISELTQIIHLLFIQNHEKDVIVSELKQDSYDYQTQMEEKLELLNKTNATTFDLDKNTLIRELKEEFFEEKKRIEENCKGSIQFLQDGLAKTVRDLSKSEIELDCSRTKYEALVVDISLREQLLQHKISVLKREVDSLKASYKILDLDHKVQINKISDSGAKHETKIEQFKNENDKLKTRVFHLLEKNARLEKKCKEMENELKTIDRRIGLQTSNTTVSQDTSIHLENTEMEELRKELDRYKLELSNRDNNFTKLFASNPNRRRLSQPNCGSKFNALIGTSQRNSLNTSVKIVSAQYDSRKVLPSIPKLYD